MIFKRSLILVFLLLFNCSNSIYKKSLTEDELKLIEKETLELAMKWVDAWNSPIDSERMMENYDRSMKYVWRGVSPPGNYEGFKKFAEDMLVPNTNYELSMTNVDITVIDKNNAIVFFHFKDKNEDPYGSGAVSLVMHQRDKDWKIIYVHESTIENTD